MRARKSVSRSPDASNDWHAAEVVAAVRMAGKSLRQLSVDNGYNPHALKDVLRRRWPKGEAIVAKAIGVSPAEIWPTRYPDQTKRRSAA